MLVLTRKANERIQIGEAITITVVNIGHGRVRIGIDAPADVPIHRSELAAAQEPPPHAHHHPRRRRKHPHR